MEKKNTIVVSAMFCCGKTFLYHNNQTLYSIIDLDEELDPKSNRGKSNKVSHIMRKDYLSKIKECLGEYDFVFIAPRPNVLQELRSSKIPYVSVYPENTPECYKEWEKRNKDRNSEWLWNACKNYWSYLLNKMKIDAYAKKHYILKENEYLSDIIDRIHHDCCDLNYPPPKCQPQS
jgi:hypothetical protein